MTRNLNQRLRRVDRRMARIDRKLGFLDGRVWFKVQGTTQWIEVSIFSFNDQGITPKNMRTGQELEAHRFSVQVDRDWLDNYAQHSGVWGITTTGYDTPLLCEIEGQAINDNETSGSLSFRVAQEIVIPNRPTTTQDISIDG